VVTLNGRNWQISGAPVRPQPDREVPVLVGAVAEQPVERAIRIGDGLIVYRSKPADFSPRRATLDRALARSSVAGGDFPLVWTSILHVAASPDQAWEEAGPGIAYLEGQLSALRGAAPAELTRQDYLVGTPDEVADRLVDIHRRTPYDHFAHWARLPGLPHQRAMETLRLVAERVIPAVSGRRVAR
jgi:alkanesulfonate monooxygenase SsuD/methylene tetrahydromethanopterin reductase-like flavin-dependent oxidoreductase (luciferase family)